MSYMQVKILEGVSAKVEGSQVELSGKNGKSKRRFNPNLIHAEVKGGMIEISIKENKKVMDAAGMAAKAFAKQISCDMEGVLNGHEVKMEIVYAHFPMTIETSGNKVIIKNMLGERAPRTAKLMGDTKLTVNGKEIKIMGISLDDVAQSAANIRKACKVRKIDERIFQDGIYYSEK